MPLYPIWSYGTGEAGEAGGANLEELKTISNVIPPKNNNDGATNTDTYVITPSQGFDGMKEVRIDTPQIANRSQLRFAEFIYGTGESWEDPMLDPDLPLTGIGFLPPKSGFVYDDDVLVAMDICEQKYNISAPVDDTLYIQPSNGKLLTQVTVNPPPREEKTITASDVQQIVTPTSGKLLSKVTVNPPVLQNPKSVSVTPSKNEDSNFDGYTQAATITPDSGYLAMKTVQVKVPQLEKNNEDLGTPGDKFESVGWSYDEDPMMNPDTMPTGIVIRPSKTGMVYDDYTYRIDDIVAFGDDIHYTVETDLGLNEDEGYIEIYPTYGKAMLGATIRTEAKVITASTEDQVVRPRTDGFYKVTVKPTPTEEKTVTASTVDQVVTPSTGKHLSKVKVSAVSVTGNADEQNVLSGKTFYKDSLTKKTGTMPNNGAVNKTLDATSDNQEFTISEGYHSGSGKVKIVLQELTRTPNDNTQIARPSNGKVLSKVTVNPVPLDTTNNKSSGYSDGREKVVTPASGMYFKQFTVQPFRHSDYCPTKNGTVIENSNTNYVSTVTPGVITELDMGEYHNYRYIRVTAPKANDNIAGVSFTVVPTISSGHEDGYSDYYTITPPSGYSGMSSARIRVPLAGWDALSLSGYQTNVITDPNDPDPFEPIDDEDEWLGYGADKAVFTISKSGWIQSGDSMVFQNTQCKKANITRNVGRFAVIPDNGKVLRAVIIDTTGITSGQSTGNATEENVLYGKTFSNSSGTGKTGSMPNKTGWTATGTAGQKTYIPKGYHDGNGYVDCPSGGVSQDLVAETLWTNPSPSSVFGAQTVTLNKSMTSNGYKYIGIQYRCSLSYANTMEILVTPTQLKNSGSTYYPTICLGVKVADSSGRRQRFVEYVSSTQLSFTTGYQNGSSTTNSGWAIPTKITGYK